LHQKDDLKSFYFGRKRDNAGNCVREEAIDIQETKAAVKRYRS